MGACTIFYTLMGMTFVALADDIQAEQAVLTGEMPELIIVHTLELVNVPGLLKLATPLHVVSEPARCVGAIHFSAVYRSSSSVIITKF